MTRIGWAVLAGGIALTTMGVALTFTSNHETRPAFTVAAFGSVAWSFLACGIVALRRRSDAHFGLLMSAVGLSWFLSSLTESNNPYVYSVGTLLWSIPLAFFIHALLAFPRGYLETKLVYGTVTATYALLGVGPLLFTFFGENSGCDTCPENKFVLMDSHVAGSIVGILFIVIGLAICGATIWVLARRWRAASPPLRRTLAPVFITSAIAIALFLLAAFIGAVSPRVSNILFWLLLVAVASVPLAFLSGLVRTRLARASVASLVLELGEAANPEATRDALRRTLGDPALELAYRLSDRDRWIDVSGEEIDVEAERDGRRASFVERDGEVVAVLLHDASLDPELVNAVSAAGALALARERSLQALRESESRYRALLDAIPDLMFRMSRDGTYLDWKGNRADLVVPPEELIGANARDVLPPAVAETLLEGIRAAIETGRTISGDYKLVIDDVERSFEARIVRDGEEAVLIVRDFTERERLHEQLERERDFIRTVVDAAPSFFCLVDKDGCIVRYNRTLELSSGRPDTDAVRGQKLWDVFIDPEDREAVRHEFAELVASDRPGEYESHWITADGDLLLVAWTVTPLTDEEGRQRFLVSGIDITDRKRHEEELHRSRIRIVEAGDTARRKLERNLHDGAQQRLVSLSLGLRLAQARLKEDPDEADRILSSSSEELAHALEELRELARGIHPAVLSERGLAAALETLAGKAPIRVDVRAPEDRLPEPVEAAAYYVVSEALANVAKYAEASAVEVSVTRMNGRAIVEVADDGVGGADPMRGSGLRGLADRVEALDGVLRVESAPGAGTRIRAEIPCG
ncbi:MAG TPA: PAS domain-containing protein [Gaiellaceae bacterium]|jgi:PAS domain S-box-containing protein|nr:PAS domain-containing protein [Gaiellaceae bacterium]